MVRAFSPLPPLLSLSIPANATIYYILSIIIQRMRLPQRVAQMLRLTRLGGQQVPGSTPIASLTGPPIRNAAGQTVMQPLTLEVRMATPGGKGGFGSMLRAQGGRMNSRRNGEENRDACRDLNGRRLSTVKQARQLAAYLASEEERQKSMSDAQKKKYAKLEKMLGRTPRGEADFVEAAHKLDDQGEALDADGDDLSDDKGEGSSSSATVAPPKQSRAPSAPEDKGKKRERIDDSEYVEQSRVLVDNVRSAVSAAMMKKKRKVGPKTGTNDSASAAKSAAAKPVTESTTKTTTKVQ